MRFVQFLFFRHTLEQTTRWTGGHDFVFRAVADQNRVLCKEVST